MSLRKHADVHAEGSLSNRLRAKRFAVFENLVARLERPLRVLDVGGTISFWEQRGWAGRDDVHITLVNLKAADSPHANVVALAGDATDLAPFADQSFDVAFSNSVIEHLYTFENQLRMAAEVRRVARAYWVQTPNFWFPIEPHFHVPGWHWMPAWMRVALLRRRRCGWRGPCPDPKEARELVDEVRLMSRREMKRAFPGAQLWAERFGGLVKSWVAYEGFPGSAGS